MTDVCIAGNPAEDGTCGDVHCVCFDRTEAESLLLQAQLAQTAFWDAMLELETALGGIEIDDSQDLEGKTIDDLIDDCLSLDEDACTCDDRSWYGREHDTVCSLSGPRAGFNDAIGGIEYSHDS